MTASSGPVTEAAVREFQEAHGLTPTGVVDSDTWAALDSPAPVPSSTDELAPRDPTGVPLGQILEPLEADFSAGSDFTSYQLACALLTGEKQPEWPAWAWVEVDRDHVVTRGQVFNCVGRTEPPADVGNWYLIALDDRGSTTWWGIGTGGADLPYAPPGLLCREYMATDDFVRAMEHMGASAPWNEDVLAYQWALAYWFLEDAPDRMDVDRNGIPCELLFEVDVVAEVWGSSVPTPSGSPSAVTLRDVLDRYEHQAMQGGLYTSISIGPCGASMSFVSDPDVVLEPDLPLSRGHVVACLIDSEPIDEPGAILIIVLDDDGTTINTAATSGEWMQIFDVEPGLSCRDFLDAPSWAGWETEPALQSSAYELVLAYWFLEGQPDRLDGDTDGLPCEEFFPPDVITGVIASGR